MYISKRYLNEQMQKDILLENYNYQFSIKDNYDIFLSYSYPDLHFAKLIYQMLVKQGFSVYADFNDSSLSRNIVTKETAQKLSETISKCKCLIYIHSRSAKNSKWCPWEIGLASGLKNYRCGILPLIEETKSEYERQEYLKLYPVIDYEKAEASKEYLFWATEDKYNYSTLKRWINEGKIEYHNPK